MLYLLVQQFQVIVIAFILVIVTANTAVATSATVTTVATVTITISIAVTFTAGTTVWVTGIGVSFGLLRGCVCSWVWLFWSINLLVKWLNNIFCCYQVSLQVNSFLLFNRLIFILLILLGLREIRPLLLLLSLLFIVTWLRSTIKTGLFFPFILIVIIRAPIAGLI